MFRRFRAVVSARAFSRAAAVTGHRNDSNTNRSTGRAALAASAAAGLAAATALGVVLAAPAGAQPGPVISRDNNTVTADALPTAQIDGVVWSQAIVGDVVYAGGKFNNARPAGAAAGTNQTARANLMAYNINTGALITSFAPTLNAQVLAVAASPDGTRLYVAGDFTTVNGIKRNRIAAFDTATGALVTSFAPNLDYKAKALVATNSTVYIGGAFNTANGVARSRLAAVSAANGSTLAWNPGADYTVNALALTPDGSKVIIGGAFQNIAGQPAYGLGAVSATDGSLQPWAANQKVRNAGTQAAILSLTTDGTAIYGTGYVYGAGGNLEGTFSADPSTGAINWVEDCHGDTYSVYAMSGVAYTVSHAHYCGNVGGFPQTNPWTFHHALAFTTSAAGTLNHDPMGYYDWFGTPSPSMINWFPDFTTGDASGQGQAAWNVTGNGKYLVMGGEFPTVNGTGQQGLVRFAVNSVAPKKQGPRLSGSNFTPSLVSLSAGTVRVSFPANWDRDDKTLSYSVVRDGVTATPVYTTTVDSTFWNRPAIGFTDTGLAPGSTHKYRLYATDPSGNQAIGDPVTIDVATTNSQTAYGQRVVADGAASYYPLNETSGSTAFDNIAFNDLIEGTGVTHGAAGAVSGDAASTFNGTGSGLATTQNPVSGPNTFSLEAWIRTTTTSGGKIIGFGNTNSGDSSSYDRHLYMDNGGRVWFGVYNNTVSTLTSPQALNDGQWHQLVASLSGAGMALYVDGKRVASRADVTVGQDYTGYWRVGGDNLGGWSNQPSSNYFAGDIDEVAIFPIAVSRQNVQAEWVASGRPGNLPVAPADNYGAAVFNDGPDSYWRLGESTGTAAADSGPSGNGATYQGGVTRGSTGAIKGTSDTAATFDGSSGVVVGTAPVSNPRTYSEEAWFKTTTNRGGKIIGFGSASSGLSGSYDRHVYMQDNGQLVYGVWTGFTNTITTPNAYNDGKWHQVVATQSTTAGMRLYVDGQLVGTNGQTDAQGYDGYWRVGGDNTWGSSSAYFGGVIDDASFYSVELTQAQVTNHWNLGSQTVAANQPPTAAFTATPTGLTVAFDAGTSTDDGSITGYSWNFGDNSTGSGVTASHTYAAGGTYTVSLTVTDNQSASNTVTKQVTVVAPNQAPTAAFTSSTTDLLAKFDASGSQDTDGSITSYSWNFGDNTAAGSGQKPSHTYASANTYTVTLTVTDNDGASATFTDTVTVTAPPPANKAPTARFTSSSSGLTASFNGTTSSDDDGTVVAWAWNFGDNTAAGSGSTPQHTYAAGGTYSVTLTVTDNSGATNSVTNQVTVTAPPATTVAADTFTRTVAQGWGTANTGGAWTTAGSNAAFATTGTTGTVQVTKAGAGPTAFLSTTSALNVDVSADIAMDKAPTGGGAYIALAARRIGTSDYRVQVVLKPTATTISVLKVVNGTEVNIKTVTVTGLTYTAGAILHLRFQAVGSGTTTLNGKVWKDGTTEPTAWQVTSTDTEAALQSAGAVGLRTYVSSSSTNVPVVFSVDNYSAVIVNP